MVTGRNNQFSELRIVLDFIEDEMKLRALRASTSNQNLKRVYKRLEDTVRHYRNSYSESYLLALNLPL